MTSDSEIRLRLKSKNREIEEFQIATPGMRLMIPSRAKWRIAARSTSGREPPGACGSEMGRGGCRRGRMAALGCAITAVAGAGGARLLRGDVIPRVPIVTIT
jgi:hypothetical protein